MVISRVKYKELMNKSFELEKSKRATIKLIQRINEKSTEIKKLRHKVEYLTHNGTTKNIEKKGMKDSSRGEENNCSDDTEV